MDLKQALSVYSRQPLPHQLLVSLLKGYKRPNDKIHELVREGTLESIRKGLYVAGAGLGTGRPEPFLFANHIAGPSYVSADSALSYYGLIPERVYEISSMTTKTTRKFTTPMGVFSYTHLPLPYYSYGIRSISLSESKDQFAIIAAPEKALFDKVVTTSGVIFRSKRNVEGYLLEDLRIDESDLKQLSTKAMREWQAEAPKKESLSLVVKTLESL